MLSTTARYDFQEQGDEIVDSVSGMRLCLEQGKGPVRIVSALARLRRQTARPSLPLRLGLKGICEFFDLQLLCGFGSRPGPLHATCVEFAQETLRNIHCREC